MEIPLLKVLLGSISSYLRLSDSDDINSAPVTRYYYKEQEILKLLKPILDAIVGSEIASNETLCKTFEELGQSVDDLRELIEYWQPLSSKIYFVLQIESLLCKIQTSCIKVLQQLKASHPHLPEELSLASLEQCMQKIKHMGHESTSSTIKDAITDQQEGNKPSSEIVEKISENLCLETNQDILIEAVALEKLKENAEQAEKTAEAEYIDQTIALVTYMHERLLAIKQSESCSPVHIPADFCCPLSLELMIDPVIVASGQTYERVYIKSWIELGLTVCPKTRQTLAHTNLIPNYTVKALIANWCESNNVKLVEPMKPVGLSQASRSLGHVESCATREVLFASSRINQLLDATHYAVGAPAKNSISSDGAKREETSLLHPQSSSDGFLPAENEHGLAIARLSLTESYDRPANTEESVLDINSHVSFFPSRRKSTSEEKSQYHIRTTSESSTLPNTNISQGTQLDANDASQVSSNLTAYSSDASAKVSPRPDATSTLTAPQRETEFPPRLMEIISQNQAIWRRSSEIYAKDGYVFCPASETRPDLSAIENQVQKLVELKSSSLDKQKEATSQLRLLAKHNMDIRIVITNSGPSVCTEEDEDTEDKGLKGETEDCEHAVTRMAAIFCILSPSTRPDKLSECLKKRTCGKRLSHVASYLGYVGDKNYRTLSVRQAHVKWRQGHRYACYDSPTQSPYLIEEDSIREKIQELPKGTLIWRAIKLPIYSVALVPLTVASAAAYLDAGIFSVKRYFVLLASSVLVITWLNLSNDVYDFDTGADKNKKESVVNLVRSRTGVFITAYVCLAIGFMGLTWVTTEAGNVRAILFLACAIMFGYIYQCPPFRLSYLGLGEPLCFAAFGPFATSAFYLLQSSSSELNPFPLNGIVLSASILIGFTTTLILFCSHFHQVEGDRAVGKMSPLVRLGAKMGSDMVKVSVMILYALVAVFSVTKNLPITCLFSCALTLPLGWMVVRYVEDHYEDKHKIFMAKYYCVRLHALFGAALASGLVVSRMMTRT